METRYMHGSFFGVQYVDIFGEPVSRTKDKFPYSYEPYLIYGSPIENRDAFRFVYSDRVQQLNSLSYPERKDISIVSKIFSEIFEAKTKVVSIAEGANQATGYPYLVYALQVDYPSEECKEGLFA